MCRFGKSVFSYRVFFLLYLFLLIKKTTQNDLILQNNFPFFKAKLPFPQKTFHKVPKTKYGDLNQAPSFLKTNSN